MNKRTQNIIMILALLTGLVWSQEETTADNPASEAAPAETVEEAPVPSAPAPARQRKVKAEYSLDMESPVRALDLTISIEFPEKVLLDHQATVVLSGVEDFQSNKLDNTYQLKGGWVGAKKWQGTFSVKEEMINGLYRLSITGAHDEMTNLLFTGTHDFEIDTIPPVIDAAYTTVINRPEADYEKCKFSINNIKDNNYDRILKYFYEYEDHGGSEAGLTTYTNIATLTDFPEGDVDFYVWAMDKAGNISRAFKTTVFSDTTRPEIVNIEKIGSIGKNLKEGGLLITFSEKVDTAILPMVSGGERGEFDDAPADLKSKWDNLTTWSGFYHMDKLNVYLDNKLRISTVRDVYGNEMFVDTGRHMPMDANALFFYGLTFYEKKEYDQAERIFEDVNRLDPIHANALIYRANIKRIRGRIKQAEKLLDEALLIEPHSAQANFQIGLCYQEQGRRFIANNHINYAKSIRNNFDNFPTDYTRKDLNPVAMVLGDYMISPYTPPSRSQIFSDHGVEEARTKQYQKAEKNFKNAEKADPQNWYVHYNMGIILCHLSRYDEALGAFGKSLEINPDNINCINNIAAAYFYKGDLENAQKYLNKALEKAGNDLMIKHNFTVLNLAADNALAKIESLKGLKKLNKPQLYNNIAYLYTLLEKENKALSYYHKAVSISGDFALAAGEAGHIYMKQKKFKKAVTMYRIALAEYPNYLTACLNLGKAYLELDEVQLAENQFNRVLKIIPNYPDAVANLSVVYNRKNLFDDSALARQEAENLFQQGFGDAGGETTAITTFKNISKSKKYKWLTVGIPEALQIDLKNLGGLRLVERMEINKAISAQAGYKEADATSASDLAKVLGASSVIIGSYQILEGTIRIDARIVRAQTGEIIRTETVDGKLADVLKLEKNLAKKLAGYYVPDVDSIGLSQGISSVKGFEYLAQSKMNYYAGEMVKAREYLNKALSEDDAVKKDMTYISVVKEENVKASGGKVAKLAVSSFKNNSGNKKYTWLEKGIGEALTTDLKKAGGIQLVERMNMEVAMKELELGQSGIIDENTAPKLGKLVGAGVVLFGSFQIMGDKIRIDARIIDTEDGSIIMTESITGKLSEILKLEEQLAMKILAALNVAVTNIERKKILNKPTVSLDELRKEITGGGTVAVDTTFTGEDRSCLVKDANDKINPVISKGGDFIVYAGVENGKRGLYRIKPDGSGLKELTTGNVLSVDIAPDDDKIVYSIEGEEGFDLYLMDFSVGNTMKLLADSTENVDPVFSPDGTMVAFASKKDKNNYDIYTIRIDNQEVSAVTGSKANERHPSWSPMGDTIAFQSDREGNWDIYSIRKSGRGEKQLTDSENNETSPAWSPEGMRIAFTSDIAGQQNLWVQNIDRTMLFKLTREPSYYPRWTADGSGIIFSKGEKDKRDIWIIK